MIYIKKCHVIRVIDSHSSSSIQFITPTKQIMTGFNINFEMSKLVEVQNHFIPLLVQSVTNFYAINSTSHQTKLPVVVIYLFLHYLSLNVLRLNYNLCQLQRIYINLGEDYCLPTYMQAVYVILNVILMGNQKRRGTRFEIQLSLYIAQNFGAMDIGTPWTHTFYIHGVNNMDIKLN